VKEYWHLLNYGDVYLQLLKLLNHLFVIVGELFVLLCATWVCEWMDGWMV